MRAALLVTLLGVSLVACGAPTPQAVGPAPAGRVWSPAGGQATVQFDPERPFLQFAPGLDLADLAGVSQGRELFVAQWQAAPGPRALLDGLGPQFIASSCAACHVSGGRASGLNADGTTAPALLFRLGDSQGRPHPMYGEQLQSAATSGLPEGQVRWSRAADGHLDFRLQVPADLGEARLGPRLAPQLVGMGLLDLVPDADLLAWADESDRDGDGVSGRPHWVTEHGQRRLGRFGWKAIHATLEGQSAAALQQDMGLTSSLRPQENCTPRQTLCEEQPSGGQPEVSGEALKAITDFLTVLGVPERRQGDRATFDRGADLFGAVGCASCHRPTLNTGASPFAALSHQTVYPYTDLLLHDMGEALSDGVREGDAAPAEWRTPALWGVGLVEAGGGGLLHDGRARDLPEAVRWHGGEARGARDRYDALPAADRAALLQFLRGL